MTNFQKWKLELEKEDLFTRKCNGDLDRSECILNCADCPACNGWDTCSPSCYDHFAKWANKEYEGD